MKLHRNQTYRLLPSILPQSVCTAMLDGFDTPGQATVHSPLKGSRIDASVRQSSVQIVEHPHWILGLMHYLCDIANREIWHYDIRCIQVAQLTCYKPGGFFDWHKDSEDGIYDEDERAEWRGLVRKLSIIVPLTPGSAYEGGNLEIKDEYGYVWRDPGFRDPGTAVVFPSGLLHRVAPIESGTRGSVVAWALGPPLR
jgi:2OG-Fe(II) oxygenase superfamily